MEEKTVERITVPGSWDYGTVEVPVRDKTGAARRAGTRAGKGVEPYLLFGVLLLLWQLAATFLPQGGNPLLPTPLVTAKALRASLPELLKGTYYSFLILLPGYLAAVAAGIAIGLLVGTTGGLNRAFTPFARVAAPIPPPSTSRTRSPCFPRSVFRRSS